MNIKNINKVIELLPDWKPSDVAFIGELSLLQGDIGIVVYSQARPASGGWPDRAKDFAKITMTFKAVSALRLELNGNDLYQLTGLDIIDISKDGLEKINFEVSDYEDGSIRLLCEDVVINNVEDHCILPIKG